MVLDKKMKEDLDSIFYSNDFLGADLKKFWNVVRSQTDYDYADVKRYYDRQELVQLYKPYKLEDTPDTTRHIVTDEPFKKFYMDTMYFGKLGFALINGIDLFSRYGFIKVFNWKRNTEEGITSKDAVKAMKDFIFEIKNEFESTIYQIITDSGSEFKGDFDVFLQQQNIKHKTTDAGDHKQLGVCERFNGTIRTMIEKYITIYGKSVRNDVPLILKTYNNRIHSTTGYAPKYILDNLNVVEPKLLQLYYGSENKSKNEQKIKGGSRVRILTRSLDQPFRKKGINWTKEIYEVEKYSKSKDKYLVNGKYYKGYQLQEIKGEVLKYTPPERERQPVNPEKRYTEYTPEVYKSTRSKSKV